MKPIDELRVRITNSTEIPDPANITWTGDWYYLDHISSGLTFYDSTKKHFRPMYAESWLTQPDGTHQFRLKRTALFHDGTPITAKDVIWSIKRQLILRTSTHFPLWEYIIGCDNIRELTDECDGMRAISDYEIAIKLKTETNSFFLQLASPETGIWSANDMDPKSARLTPTKFSGPYYVAERDDQSALLKRNGNWPNSGDFPNSPRSIRLKKIPLSKLDDALTHREVDLAVRSHNALGEPDWKSRGIEYQTTTPSGMFYLFGLGSGFHPEIGRDFIEAAWRLNQDPILTPADSYLPFAAAYGLKRSDFLSQLPTTTAKLVRILLPEGFLSQAFLDQLQKAAQAVHSRLEFHFLPGAEWSASFEDPKASEKYDYILSIYAASERYPAVQLRYLTKKGVTSPIDLKKAESPDLTSAEIVVLQDYQKWLLQSRRAIPIYFNVTAFLHQKNIDMGEQPASDAEIELWRVQVKQ